MVQAIIPLGYSATQAEIDAGVFNAKSGGTIQVVNSSGQPTGVQYDVGAANVAPTLAVTGSNINTVLAAAGGAGWGKAQATAPNYTITKPASGAGLDLHIESGGSLATLTSIAWPVPATGVDQLRIRNFSGSAKTFTAGAGWTIVTADGNPITGGSYSIPDDRAVEITLDPDGFAQVVPWGGEVSEAVFNVHTGNVANPHVVTAAQVGLGNVTNTSDANKPVSTAQQTALNLKQDASTAATDAELTAHTGNTANPHGVTKAQVGLANAENTTDLLKVVSTATQAALDLKAPLASPTFTGAPLSVTPAVDTNTTQIATTAFVNAQLSGTLPLMDGTATVGSGTRSARGNHVHPKDTTKQDTLVSGTTIKTINGVALPGSGNIVIAPTTVSSTVPTHNLDLVSDNYAGRALHLRPNGMTATANLATWSDSSGNGRDVAQATAANQPDVVETVLNGLPVVRFDGTDDFLANVAYPAPTALSIFVVFKSTVSNRGIITLNAATNIGIVYLTNGEGTGDKFGVYGVNAVPGGWLSHPTSITNLWTIGGVTVSATSLDVYVNGVVTTRALTTAVDLASIVRIDIGRRIDGGVYHNGDIAEAVIFPTVLSTIERQKVEGYLAHKFALLANLDAGHPYKTTAPQAGSLQVFADQAAAIAGSLTVGQVYVTSTGQLMAVY